jgi:excisionase family DNA binding protein
MKKLEIKTEKKYYSIQEICETLGVSRQSAVKLAQKIGFVNLGTGKRRLMRVDITAFDKHMSNHTIR